MKSESEQFALKELVGMTRQYGSDPEFVLAGGGNSSYKNADYLYVKASGTRMADIGADGFVKMSLAGLKDFWKQSFPGNDALREAKILERLLACRVPGESRRPSVETLLHSLFTQPYVLHLHPPLVNGLTCARDGARKAGELFEDEVLWIPVTKPGYSLAVRTRQALEDYRNKEGREAKIVLIQNHGLLLAGASVKEIEEQSDFIFSRLRSAIKSEPDLSPLDEGELERLKQRAVCLAPALRMLQMEESCSSTSIVTFRTNREIGRFLKDSTAFEPISSAFTPDHIVYCNRAPLFIGHRERIDDQYSEIVRSIARHRKSCSYLPKLFAVQGLGIFAWGRSKSEANTALTLFEDTVKVAVYARNFGGSLFMPPDQVEFIEKWEAERFRRQKVNTQATTADARNRLGEKVCIVTGGARGFGKGIAEYLVSAGANVVIADLDYEPAASNATEFCLAHGPGRAIAVATDVGVESSVENMIRETVLSYGGLDVYVNNAGVLKAGGLEEMSTADFDFVTKINYRAYFLGAKLASRIMKIQHSFNRAYFMDIVQINSKSGLAGSNRNFAYAGGKFGGIGLTQSFALELVGYNIKVNALCPGNYFDGPLWSDLEKGLFVQYLKTGKVPGARTAQDVRRFYEDKVPMKRGCGLEDLAKALFYVIEQKYETGQAVPITGGQIMLR